VTAAPSKSALTLKRATRPLAKPVQIARGLAAVARTAPITGGPGARAAA
jgi:hypothetical protein